jgi:hypothetical protein
MLLADLTHACSLYSDLDKYTVPLPDAENILKVAFKDGTPHEALWKEWFQEEGPAEIRASIKKWLKAKRASVKTQLSALDAQIAIDVATLPD